MNYLQLNRIYKSFSESEQKFINEKTIEASYTIKQWMILLQKVAAYDEANDRIRKKMITWIVIFAIAAFVFLFIFWYVSILFALVMVLIIVMRKKLVSKDLSNHLRLFLIPLLKVLYDKAGLRAPFTLKLDFRPHGKQEMQDKYKVGNRTIRQFNPKWLSGSVMLKDQSILELHLLDDLKKLTVKKTNARGKTKIKSKVKSTHFLLIKLVLSNDIYQLKSEVPEDIVADQDAKKITLKAKHKHKVTSADDVLSVNQFLNLLESMYQAVEALPGKMPAATIDSEEEEIDDSRFDDDSTSMDAAGVAGVAATSFFVWSAYDFNDYDYDNFDYESAPVFGDELDNDSIFDS